MERNGSERERENDTEHMSGERTGVRQDKTRRGSEKARHG